MSYDRFCKRYRESTVRKQAVSRAECKAGRIPEVDRAGPTKRLVDPATGEVSKVFLFVACLPFSRLSYVEPTLDMREDTWLRCHVHAFAYMGGSTPCIVPDNLKTGVKNHPREGGVVLNSAYREMAAHSGSAVMPARIATPRDKPSAESEVRRAALEIIAALRDTMITDLDKLKRAVAERLEGTNARPFTKCEGTRRQVLGEREGPLLRPLPAAPFGVCEWVYGRKVQRNCHVAYRRNHCSVSHLAVGKTVDLRVADSTAGGLPRRREARHAPAVPGLRPEPLPDARRRPARREVVLRLGRRAHREVCGPRRSVPRGGGGPLLPARGLRGAGPRRSSRGAQARAPPSRAQARARPPDGAGLGQAVPRCKHLRPMLETNRDLAAGTRPGDDGGPGEDGAGYVRGADFYGEA